MPSQIVKLTSRNEIDQSLLVMDYVLGHLSDNEKANFEARLINDKSLQQALSEELQLKRLITGEKTEFKISDDALSQFSAQIRTEKQKTYRPKRMAFAAMISLFFIGYSYYPTQNSTEFETLSNNQMQLISNHQQLEYTLIFATNIKHEQFKAIADLFELSIISGPGAAGSYLVRAAAPLNAQQLLAIRQHESIVFIEPAISIKQ